MKLINFFTMILLSFSLALPAVWEKGTQDNLSPESLMVPEGKSFENFLKDQFPDSDSEIPDIVRIKLAKEVLVFYLNLFFENLSDDVIPAVRDLNELSFNGSLIKEDEKLEISFKKKPAFYPLSSEEDLEERAKAVTQFLKDLFDIVASQKVKNEQFLFLILDSRKTHQKAYLLSSLLINYQINSESSFMGVEAITMVDELLAREKNEYLNLRQELDNEMIKRKLANLDKLINAFPVDQSLAVSVKANQFLMDFFQAENVQVSDRAKALFAERNKIQTKHVRRLKPEERSLSSSI